MKAFEEKGLSKELGDSESNEKGLSKELGDSKSNAACIHTYALSVCACADVTEYEAWIPTHALSVCACTDVVRHAASLLTRYMCVCARACTDGMKLIGEARGMFAGLLSLSVSSNELTGNAYNATMEGSVAMCDSIKAAKSLTHLNFSDNGLSNEVGNTSCLPLFCQSLRSLQKLVYLDLSSNSIGIKGSRVFAAALNCLKNLEYLDIKSNQFGSGGVKIIVPALNKSLTSMNLSSNDVGPEGIAGLTVQLQTISNLVRLDLSKNHLQQAYALHVVSVGDDKQGDGSPATGMHVKGSYIRERLPDEITRLTHRSRS